MSSSSSLTPSLELEQGYSPKRRDSRKRSISNVNRNKRVVKKAKGDSGNLKNNRAPRLGKGKWENVRNTLKIIKPKDKLKEKLRNNVSGM